MNVGVDVEVVLALPGRQQVFALTVAPGCSAREAVRLAVAAGLDLTGSGVDAASVPLGVWGERVEDDRVVLDGERVELYRPLITDPRERRRRRAAAARAS